ncbi:MAG: gliding motility-associated C-terminal domain-containing protein [Tannerellaceae bacterium]|jgi:gliding motility-associated-like protein|nr:gliding motility-associated C-terminal domain-containing protein [Tannerellaceae bacterium]
MWRKDSVKVAGILSMLFFTAILHAQYAVSGGKGLPLLALDDTPNRLQVYLVHGVEGLRLQYTSASAAHRWYRYTSKAIEAEELTAVQEGTTSTLHTIEEGCGYFVEEAGALPRYIWIIDYSRHAFSVQDLRVTQNDNPCDELWLEGTARMPQLIYYAPNGLRRELERSFEVVYNTLEYADEGNYFSQQTFTGTLTGDPFNAPLVPPLCDTEITLKGDLFARHFGMEQSASTETYQAVALRAQLDTTVLSLDGPNMSGKGNGLSAPVDVHFEAIANEPVAAFCKWTVVHKKEKQTETILSFTGRSMDYTFRDEGVFVATLEIGDRTGRCSWTDSVSIEIGVPYLSAPNVFSPGTSPGVNDEFRVAYKSLVSFRGWIFNRWGVEMFYWTDPAKGWDGKKGGKYVPPGVYFYVIEAKGSDGKNHSLKGHINIIRPKNGQNKIIE